MITARLAQEDDLPDLRVAYTMAALHCSHDNEPLIPPDDILRNNAGRHLYLARDEDGRITGTAIMDQHREDFVWWLTIMDASCAADTWAALGDAIAGDRGIDPHGYVGNPELRALLTAHPRLNNEDPEDEKHLTWRQP